MKNKLIRLAVTADEDTGRELRKRKGELQRMEKENQQARDIISKLNKNSTKQGKEDEQITHMQNQLRTLAFKLGVEHKKNKVLKELIDLTNQCIMDCMKTTKVDSDQMHTAREKQLKKQQYDIEQILQKHNEEVAKINVLREQISFSRRERVVYSNLFKKIEKQIKIYEERFKQTLWLAHQTERKKKQLTSEESVFRRKLSERILPLKTRNSGRNEQVKFTVLEQPQNLNRSLNIFLTHAPTHSRSKNQTQKRCHKASKASQQLEKYRNLFDILRVHIKDKDCSLEQMLYVVKNLQNQNEQLNKEIEFVNNQIVEQESQEMLLCKEAANKKHQQGQTTPVNEHIGQQQTLETLTIEIDEEQHALNSRIGMMRQLYMTVCEADIQQDPQHFCLDNATDCFRQIELQLNRLNSFEDSSMGRLITQQSRKGRDYDNEHHIFNLIDRIQRYNESEKVLSRQALFEECSKEMFKIKKVKQKTVAISR